MKKKRFASSQDQAFHLNKKSSVSQISRRSFIAGAGGLSAEALALSAMGASPQLNARDQRNARPNNSVGRQRAEQAFKIRMLAALQQRELDYPDHPTNGDEERFVNKIGSFTKAFVHNKLGEVDLSAYNMLVNALTSGRPGDFENIPLGDFKKLANPQAAYCFVLEGTDPHQPAIPAPPAFSSAEQAAEMAELYWQALARDVPFSRYDSHPITNAAAADLSRMAGFNGPKINRQVTTDTLFRGNTAGDLTGPYISQFLLHHIPYGNIPIVQRGRTAMPDIDYLFTYSRWLAVQNGDLVGPIHLDPTLRYIRNARDLAEYTHKDFTYQAFLSACLILTGMNATLDSGNPYRRSDTQSGFSTFGEPHILDLVARVANHALKTTWFQKWLVHRRLRPEEFGGRVHLNRTGAVKYPIHSDLLNSEALDQAFKKKGSYLLTQAYPEGCPFHPAYPGGHSAIAGACVTVLKAFFNELMVIRTPVVASEDGLSLEPYSGPDLTVGGELNKLAFNIGMGRNFAGIHWRSDCADGLKLGEEIAIGLLSESRNCSNENFSGFSLTKFDGTTITV